jgi:hypothetical protein
MILALSAAGAAASSCLTASLDLIACLRVHRRGSLDLLAFPGESILSFPHHDRLCTIARP